MHWLAITGLAIFSRAFYSVSTKHLSSSVRVSAQTQSIILPFVAAAMSLLLIPFLGFSLDGLAENWWVVLLLALSQGAGNIIYFYGQVYIDSGLTQVALSSKLVWSALASMVFLGSRFDAIQVVGMAVMLVAIVLVQQLGKKNKDIKKGLALIALSAVVFTVFAIAGADLSSKINPVAYLLAAYGGASLFALGVGYRRLERDWPYLKKHALTSSKAFFYAAGASTLYFLLIYYAYREAPDAGVVAVLINAQVVTTVFVGAVLLGERQHIGRKLLASGLVLVSAYLISGI